jgi:hypothetical protein
MSAAGWVIEPVRSFIQFCEYGLLPRLQAFINWQNPSSVSLYRHFMTSLPNKKIPLLAKVILSGGVEPPPPTCMCISSPQRWWVITAIYQGLLQLETRLYMAIHFYWMNLYKSEVSR